MALPFVRNLGLKALSICIAALLWLAVAGERVVERVVRVPVEYESLPGDLEIVGNPPELVDVRVRGSSGALSRMNPGDLSLRLDLRMARRGPRLYHVTPGQVHTPYGMEIVQVTPATVMIEFETTGLRLVRVKPSIDGEPAAGHRIGGVTADPATVEVTGPEGALAELTEAITEPVSVANRTGTVREIVTVGVANSSIRVRAPQQTTVTVTIVPVKP
jgi:YbbR domain-containing protein